MSTLLTKRNWLFFVGFFVFSARCQELPAPLVDLLQENSTPGTVVFAPGLSQDQRHLFWAGTEATPFGYLKIQQSIEYLHLIDFFLKNAHKETLPRTMGLFSINLNQLNGLSYIGSLLEDRNRVNYLFRTQRAVPMMLTVWDFKASGAQMVIPVEFLNQTVHGRRAVMSLLVASGSTDCLWKLAWWDDGLSFEFYLVDRLDVMGRPASTTQEVIAIASGLTSRNTKSN